MERPVTRSGRVVSTPPGYGPMISLLFLIVVAGVTVLAEEAGHFEWAVLWLLFSIWARLMVIDETLREVR